LGTTILSRALHEVIGLNKIVEIEKLKKSLFNGFIAIQKLEGIPNKTKHRMLWEMFVCNGENTLFWEVVGITETAGQKIKENNYKLPTGSKENKVNRSHIYSRIETSMIMLEKTDWTMETWWNFYRERDKCVLATGTENMSKEKEVIKYQVPEGKGLFPSAGFSCRIGDKEKEFLIETIN
jgi:hypothetical protein